MDECIVRQTDRRKDRAKRRWTDECISRQTERQVAATYVCPVLIMQASWVCTTAESAQDMNSDRYRLLEYRKTEQSR